MVRIDIDYEGELHCRARHGPSGRLLETDAPVDNHGKGESFSPTDLLATGLGTCMATTMGIVAKRNGWDLTGMTVSVEKVMSNDPPRRVARLETTLMVPSSRAVLLDEAPRAELERTAHNCPVRLSLAPSVDVPVTFVWGASEATSA